MTTAPIKTYRTSCEHCGAKVVCALLDYDSHVVQNGYCIDCLRRAVAALQKRLDADATVERFRVARLGGRKVG